MLDAVHHMKDQYHKFEHRSSNFGYSPEIIAQMNPWIRHYSQQFVHTKRKRRRKRQSLVHDLLDERVGAVVDDAGVDGVVGVIGVIYV